MNAPPNYADVTARYANTAEGNDASFQYFTARTAGDPVLAAHRAHVETHKLGYGDPAFHSMWACLLAEAGRRFDRVRTLEIGVFKGQVLSLWSLLAREYALNVEIHAVTPLSGNPAPAFGLWHRLRFRIDSRYREQVRTANFYAEEDYAQIVRDHFAHYGLDYGAVKLHRGFSTDPRILEKLASARFEIIYVDGDHTEAGARHDFAKFGAKVVPGGWLVADDAAADLPGTAFWKGYPEVTKALEELIPLGFVNVLNVGHNRIFQRRSDSSS